MASYKDYPREFIGSSDAAKLAYIGSDGSIGFIPFIEDGEYSAYIVDKNAEIGEHYALIAFGTGSLRLVDDEGVSWTCGCRCSPHAKPEEWKIFRAGNFGCIIQLIY